MERLKIEAVLTAARAASKTLSPVLDILHKPQEERSEDEERSLALTRAKFRENSLKSLEKGASLHPVMKLLLGDLLVDKRNARAVEVALAAGGDFSMVWGAAHIPGMMALLKEAGFEVKK